MAGLWEREGALGPSATKGKLGQQGVRGRREAGLEQAVGQKPRRRGEVKEIPF